MTQKHLNILNDAAEQMKVVFLYANERYKYKWNDASQDATMYYLNRLINHITPLINI